MDEPEVTAESLLKAAAEHDAGRGTADNEPEVTDPEPETTKDKAAKPEAKPEEKKDEPTAKDSKAESAEKKPDEKPKSKWAQNEERKNKTWQEINAEKEAIKAEKETLQREKSEIQRRSEEIQRAKVTSEPLRDEHGYTSKDYKGVASDYRQKALDAATPAERKQLAEFADAADQVAEKLNQKHQQLMQERNVADLRAKWQEVHDKLVAKPEYADLKTEGSELHKQTLDVLRKYPFLTMQPDGLQTAVELVEQKAQLKAFDGTKAELTKLKEEHSKLQKKLSIGGGSPTGAPAEETPFNELSTAEQHKRLERAAHSQDREAGFD